MPSEMTQDTSDIIDWENAIIETFAAAGDTLGFPRSVSMMYGLLFASREPLSMEDIIVRLKMSKGGTSQGLKLLVAIGAVKKQPQIGERKMLYIPERSLRRLVQRLLDSHIAPRIDSGKERISALSSMIPEGPEYDYARSCNTSLEAWHTKASKLLPMINMILK